MQELERIFSQWSRRYRIQRAIRWASVGLVAGLSVGLGFALVALTQNVLLRNEFILISLGMGIFTALIAFVAGYFWRLDRQTAAQLFDQKFQLKERVSTAFELSENEASNKIPAQLVERQLQDTVLHARGIEVHKRLPLKVDRTQLAISFVLMLAIAVVGWRGEQFFRTAQTQRAVQAAIDEQIEQIEALHDEIESDPNLAPEQKEELLQPLEEAMQGLEEAQNMEQAVSVLTSTQERLAALENAEEQQQALQQLGEALSGPLQEVGDKLASGDALAAAQELANLDTTTMSQEEQQQLAEQLQEAAQALESTDSELAEQLNDAAQALQSGDTQVANAALDDAAQSLSQAGQQIAQSEVASQAAAQVGQGKDQILQAGQSAAGQPAGSTSGSNAGQGQSQSNQSGSGAGQEEGSGDSQGPEAGDDPIEQDNDPGDGGESAYEPIYAPTRLGGESDEQVSLPESGDPGEEVIGTEDTVPGEPGESSVPYVEVYSYYAEFYRQAISSGQIPSAYSELVRQYFLSLEP